MKSMILVALALVAVAAAAPVENDEVKSVKIVNYEFDQQPDGTYRYRYEGEDGNKREEEGTLKEALDEDNKPHTVIVVRGSYSYVGPDGKPEVISYFADENGYIAEGDSIPKAAST